MHLTILTQYYPPEVGAPQNRLSDLAKQFVSAGHRVTVVTAMPNYPAGKIHKGYGGLLKHENKDGVRILRTFIHPCQSSALVPRLLSYFSFVFSSALFGSFVLSESDFLLVESPPLFLGIAGVWLSWLKRAKLIFNVSDLWPESAVQLGVVSPDSWGHRFGLFLESFCYRRAWAVTGQSTSILQDINTRFPDLNPILLSNGTDTSLFCPQPRSEKDRNRLGGEGDFIVLYAGLHGLAQGLDQILESAATLQREGGYRFVLVGDGPQKLQLMHRAQTLQLQNVTFRDPVPFAEMPKIVAAADAVIVPLAKHIPGAVPSKLYEAMASGRPLVLVAGGEAAELVNRYQAGIVIPPGREQSLAPAIRRLRVEQGLAAQFSKNARCAAVKHFDRKRIAEVFIKKLESKGESLVTPSEQTVAITPLRES